MKLHANACKCPVLPVFSSPQGTQPVEKRGRLVLGHAEEPAAADERESVDDRSSHRRPAEAAPPGEKSACGRPETSRWQVEELKFGGPGVGPNGRRQAIDDFESHLGEATEKFERRLTFWAMVPRILGRVEGHSTSNYTSIGLSLMPFNFLNLHLIA